TPTATPTDTPTINLTLVTATPTFTNTPTPSATWTPLPAGEAHLGNNPGQIQMGDGQIWTYSGQARQIVSIRVNAGKPANEATDEQRVKQGLLDTIVTLYAPDGMPLAQNDDISHQPQRITDSLIENFTLPDSGVYRIEVRAFGDATAGGYTLS